MKEFDSNIHSYSIIIDIDYMCIHIYIDIRLYISIYHYTGLALGEMEGRDHS